MVKNNSSIQSRLARSDSKYREKIMAASNKDMIKRSVLSALLYVGILYLIDSTSDSRMRVAYYPVAGVVFGLLLYGVSVLEQRYYRKKKVENRHGK